jgi:two-component system NtrC family sensor kinase
MADLRYLERRIVREVAARKEAERLLEAKSEEIYEKNAQLEASAQRLEQAFELLNSLLGVVPDILITCNDRHMIEMINESSLGILGYQQPELIGAHISKLFPGLLPEMMSGQSFIIPDIKMRKADGSLIDTEIHGNVIQAQGREFLALLVLDTAARKAAEKMKDDIYWQLQEARRLEAIGALSGGIAHELNTPIQFIGDNITFVDQTLKKIHNICWKYEDLHERCVVQVPGCDVSRELLAYSRQTDLGQLIAEVLRALKETREGIDHVSTIIGLVKEFSHPGTGAPETVNINTVIGHALAICRFRCQGLKAVNTALADPPPPLKCHPSQIQQVIINIVVNAVEAIEEDGRTDGQIEVATRVEAPYFRIEISDNGPGIIEGVRDHVFDPFFTTKRAGKGTGQGLALAREIIVAQHGGRLYLGEKPGFATTFVIELPLEAAQTAQPRRERAHAQS